jgi:aryl-alcohol dehydrogenase (NADP+)
MVKTNPLRRRLGRTEMQVFPLNLGGNVFGWTADRGATFAVLDAYREAGGNFVDTADVYSKWVPGNAGGESETLIGAWLASRRCRDEFIIATKVGGNGPGLSARLVRRGVEGSLRRLGVERIDLLYAHHDDPATPLVETMRAFDVLVREGKVRAIGASNFSARRFAEANDISARYGLASFVVVQPEYSLVSRDALDGELIGLSETMELAVCTHSALASGFLTGKYRASNKSRHARARSAQRWLDDLRAVRRLEALTAVARKHGAAPARVALAWQLHKTFVTSPIASATSEDQVNELVASVHLQLDADDMEQLDA